MNSFSLLINTCLFIGKIPIAPGTMGSFFALIIWFFLAPSVYSMIICIILLTILSYYTISTTLLNEEEKDPQFIVIDEAIGIWIALICLPTNNIFFISLAFILFRLLDILKPSIIFRSQFFPGALGVLLDDIISGIIVCLILLGITSL